MRERKREGGREGENIVAHKARAGVYQTTLYPSHVTHGL